MKIKVPQNVFDALESLKKEITGCKDYWKADVITGIVQNYGGRYAVIRKFLTEDMHVNYTKLIDLLAYGYEVEAKYTQDGVYVIQAGKGMVQMFNFVSITETVVKMLNEAYEKGREDAENEC